MAKIEVGDVELYYEIHGEGVPVVLIHGLAGDCSAWAPQIKVLEKSYKVVALDNRGAGRSSAPDYPYTSRHFADDTIGLMDALDISEPAHVIGRSMGGAIAQEMAINYPERVRSMLITASFGKLDRYGHRILYNLNEVVKAQGYMAASRHRSISMKTRNSSTPSRKYSGTPTGRFTDTRTRPTPAWRTTRSAAWTRSSARRSSSPEERTCSALSARRSRSPSAFRGARSRFTKAPATSS